MNEKDLGKIKEELKTYLPEEYISNLSLEEILDFYNKYVLDWNDVKEKLPKENEEVLIFSKKIFIIKEKLKKKYICKTSIGYYSTDFGWFDLVLNHYNSDVLYWKPFPKESYIIEE